MSKKLQPLIKFGIEQEGVIVENTDKPYIFSAYDWIVNAEDDDRDKYYNGTRFGCDGSSNTQETASEPVLSYKELKRSMKSLYRDGLKLIPEGSSLLSIPCIEVVPYKFDFTARYNNEYKLPMGMHITISINNDYNNNIYTNCINNSGYRECINQLEYFLSIDLLDKIEGNFGDNRRDCGYGLYSDCFRVQPSINGLEFRLFGACGSVPMLEEAYIGIYLNFIIGFIIKKLSSRNELSLIRDIYFTQKQIDEFILLYNTIISREPNGFLSDAYHQFISNFHEVRKYFSRVLDINLLKSIEYLRNISQKRGGIGSAYYNDVFKVNHISKKKKSTNTKRWCCSCFRIEGNCRCLEKYHNNICVSKIGEVSTCKRCYNTIDKCICYICSRCGMYDDTLSKECTCIRCGCCYRVFNNQEYYDKHLCPECNKCPRSSHNFMISDYVRCSNCGSYYSWYDGSQWWVECSRCYRRSSTVERANNRCDCRGLRAFT